MWRVTFYVAGQKRWVDVAANDSTEANKLARELKGLFGPEEVEVIKLEEAANA
jgi:hypothetical protein